MEVKLRKFDPLPKNHPLIGQKCPACNKPFAYKDIVTLIPIGPGDDEEEKAKCYDGHPYRAIALTIHWACATGDPHPERNLVILPPGTGGPLGSQ